jgi:hypothetical protein
MLEKKHRACLAIKIQALVGADGVVRFSEMYPFAALILRSAVVLTLRGICNMAETWQEGKLYTGCKGQRCPATHCVYHRIWCCW